MNRYIEQVEKFYSKDEKKYHTIHHVERLFDLYNQYRDEFIKEFPNINENALFEAMAYHDCVYVIGDKFNEELSAQAYLKDFPFAKSHVYNAILSTKVGCSNFKNDVEKILHDLDWSSFSQDYELFTKDAEGIIYEAVCEGRYPENMVRANQKKFYENYMDKDIYVTNTFSKFNEIARMNLKRRHDEL